MIMSHTERDPSVSVSGVVDIDRPTSSYAAKCAEQRGMLYVSPCLYRRGERSHPEDSMTHMRRARFIVNVMKACLQRQGQKQAETEVRKEAAGTAKKQEDEKAKTEKERVDLDVLLRRVHALSHSWVHREEMGCIYDTKVSSEISKLESHVSDVWGRTSVPPIPPPAPPPAPPPPLPPRMKNE